MFEEEITLLKRLSDNYADEINMDFRDGASPEDIAAFEQETGLILPEEVRALYQEVGGFDGFMTYMNLWDLEMIEKNYKAGYNDWVKKGDGDQYLVLGSTGGGEYLLMEITSGQLLRYGDEGDVMPIPSMRTLLYWNIETLYENVSDEEDAIIEDYLQKMRIND
ncbi:MAG: SMI1/KNR4 family protein [Oscillospiraceae bacterium]|nr:SMI1/KNR4 family protein [Oscillospiraceae bacterium]